jgi:chromate transport protein ChrA
MKNKIQKISSLILWIILGLSLIVALLFYFGGEVPETRRIIFGYSQPVFSGLFIDWTLFVLSLCLCLVIFFPLYKWIINFNANPVRALLSIAGFLIIIVLLAITWLIGKGTPLNIINYSGHENTYFWLKLSDMWLYTITILVIVAASLTIFFESRNFIQKKKKTR